MKEKDVIAALAALAQEARLRIFRALVGAAPHGVTPSELAAMLGVPASTLSFHLKGLIHAGLANVERDGRNLHYSASIPQMNALMGYLTDHCCQGAGCSPSRRPGRTATC